jgi:maltose alpha-D-glucosyltransferase/alpha-amylase
MGGSQLDAAAHDLGIALVKRRQPRDGNLPVAATVKWTRFDPLRPHPNALAAVRQPRQGTLLDAAADAGFISLVLENLRASRTIEVDQRRLEFLPTHRFSESAEIPIEDVRGVDTEQSNTTALVNSHYVVKLFRRLVSGSIRRSRSAAS